MKIYPYTCPCGCLKSQMQKIIADFLAEEDEETKQSYHAEIIVNIPAANYQLRLTGELWDSMDDVKGQLRSRFDGPEMDDWSGCPKATI